MGLVEQARKDAAQYTSDPNGFGVSIQFTAPTGEVETVNGLHKRHHLGINPATGEAKNTEQASVTVSEQFLTDLNYPVRNAEGDVDLQKHLVEVADSTGETIKYVIEQWFPDETVGLIVCILGTFKEV